MYPLKPIKVYMLDRVKKDKRCVTRMNRMLKAIGFDRKKVICIHSKNLSKMVHELENLQLPEKLPPKQIKSYTAKVGVIGMTPIKMRILNAVIQITSINAKGFKTELEAKEWLVG